MACRFLYSTAFISALFFHLVLSQSFNPTILQDSRDLPKVDGTFGFLYRTEDGIAHAAKGDSNGVIHGRFSYTDPTGLKVNYNYNAGSRVPPGYDETRKNYQQPKKQQYQQQSVQEYREPQYDYDDNAQYVEPQQQQQYVEPQKQQYADLQQQYVEPQTQQYAPPKYVEPQYLRPQTQFVVQTTPAGRRERRPLTSRQQAQLSGNAWRNRRTWPPYNLDNDVNGYNSPK